MGKQQIVLITGGARSGKSKMALQLAAGETPKIFLATAEALDSEMKERIQKHRLERGNEWVTIEEPLEPDRILRENQTQTIIVDCITLWLSNLLIRSTDERKIDGAVNRFCEALKSRPGTTIVVTNEVGLGIVPDNEMARLFRDLAGNANQKIAGFSSRVILMVSGIPLNLR